MTYSSKVNPLYRRGKFLHNEHEITQNKSIIVNELTSDVSDKTKTSPHGPVIVGFTVAMQSDASISWSHPKPGQKHTCTNGN